MALPIEEMIEQGLCDLAERGEAAESLPALLVSVGAPRLRTLGLDVPASVPSPEMRLYEHLARAHPEGGAHSRYNALIRRLVSYERALACVKRRTEARSSS